MKYILILALGLTGFAHAQDKEPTIGECRSFAETITKEAATTEAWRDTIEGMSYEQLVALSTKAQDCSRVETGSERQNFMYVTERSFRVARLNRVETFMREQELMDRFLADDVQKHPTEERPSGFAAWAKKQCDKPGVLSPESFKKYCEK